MTEKRLIINLTQHRATEEQKQQNVIDVPEQFSDELKKLLTFDELPTEQSLHCRAVEVARFAVKVTRFLENRLEQTPIENYQDFLDPEFGDHKGQPVMIGGAPYFMPQLEEMLCSHGFDINYAFSLRESKEVVLEDGSVKKTQIFKHIGFIHKTMNKDYDYCQEN